MSLRAPTEASDFDYTLPDELIAQRPLHPRDACRLLALRGGRISHESFRDLPRLLHAADLLVLNETRVIPARLHGTRAPTGGAVELVLLRPAHETRYDDRATRWLALAKPARRLRAGQKIAFDELGEATVVAEHEQGVREVDLALNVPFEAFLARAGKLPLPPYVREDSPEAQAGYQTIFAREPGSVAAPTASLHFTETTFEALAAKGVQVAKLTLDVGLGSFRPMRAERLDDHKMQGETYVIPEATAAAVSRAKNEGRRVVAAGTTVVRALEAAALEDGSVRAMRGETDLFITPGFRFRVVDALITNFHLPRSTLLVLVCAFAGREQIFGAYREAIERGYRFYSFGDAMYVEP